MSPSSSGVLCYSEKYFSAKYPSARDASATIVLSANCGGTTPRKRDASVPLPARATRQRVNVRNPISSLHTSQEAQLEKLRASERARARVHPIGRVNAEPLCRSLCQCWFYGDCTAIVRRGNYNCRQALPDAAFWDARRPGRGNNLADITRQQLHGGRGNSKEPRLSVARYFTFVDRYHARSLITEISLEESVARNNLQPLYIPV